MAELLDLGRLSYLPAWDRQGEIQAGVIAGDRQDTLIFVEHPPVLTLGANFHDENLRLPREEYGDLGIEVVTTDRGGDVTFHGPNQLVIYPIFDLRQHGKDLHQWLRNLEEAIILVCADFSVTGKRSSVNTGVWVDDKKVAAIGIKVSKWVSIHGIALNCNNDLSPFDTIVPCGIHNYGVTSLSLESNREITIEDAKPKVISAFETVFGISIAR